MRHLIYFLALVYNCHFVLSLLCGSQLEKRLFKEECHISYIFFFLVFLQTSSGFIQIKTYKLHYFYLSPYSETTNCCGITVTTMFLSGLDLCIFPCFKYVVYQLNSLLRWSLNDLVLFSARIIAFRTIITCSPLRAPSWILNLKMLAQRFQVCYAQKHTREIWHHSFKKTDTLSVFNWSFSILFQGQMIQF